MPYVLCLVVYLQTAMFMDEEAKGLPPYSLIGLEIRIFTLAGYYSRLWALGEYGKGARPVSCEVLKAMKNHYKWRSENRPIENSCPFARFTGVFAAIV